MEETKKPQNLSAFPEPYVNDPNLGISHTKGMTLRDYFAAKAMQSVIVSSNYDNCLGNNGMPVPDFVAEQSYQIADAMLLTREL